MKPESDSVSVSAAMERFRQSLSSKGVTPSPVEYKSLPSWHESNRGAPNILLRSALFSASRVEMYLQRADIFAQKPTRIRYTGTRLTQSDHDVWLTLLHLCQQNLSKPLPTSAYELLKCQGKADTGANRKTLYSRLDRLKATALEVSINEISYTGSLIDEIYRDSKTQQLIIVLNAKLATLFGQSGITYIDWQVRRSLTNKPLAQWLHGYYSSHRFPYPVGAQTLLRMSGVDDKSPASAEQNLRRALEALKHASATGRTPLNYELEGGKICVLPT